MSVHLVSRSGHLLHNGVHLSNACPVCLACYEIVGYVDGFFGAGTCISDASAAATWDGKFQLKPATTNTWWIVGPVSAVGLKVASSLDAAPSSIFSDSGNNRLTFYFFSGGFSLVAWKGDAAVISPYCPGGVYTRLGGAPGGCATGPGSLTIVACP